jgi:hypothetical protein
MTVPTNTVTEHSVVGTREDLADVIYNIAPTDTPFMNNIARTSASQVYHEWQTDTLDAAAANRAIEGDDPTAKTFSASTRLGNYCQISEKTVIVSGTSISSDQAGRANELSYQVARRGKELKRDMEFALTQNQASSAGGAGTARSLASLESWLATNKTTAGNTANGATTPGFASGVVAAPTDASTNGTLEKADIDAVIRSCWDNGGEPNILMCNSGTRERISELSGISTLQTDANVNQKTSIIGSVDFYKSNFGVMTVQPNRFQRDATLFVLDYEMFAVAFLRDIQMFELSKTGDNEKRQMLAEYTLVSRNELGSGKITDIDSTLGS